MERDPSPLVRAVGIDHAYGRSVALVDVNLTVLAGQVVGLVGPNGSGKTTLLHVIAGLVSPTAGTPLACGYEAGTIPARRRTVLVPDEPTGFDELTVAEFLSLTRSLWHGGANDKARGDMLAEAFGLGSRRHLRLGALSRGFRRRVAMVAAFQLALPVTLVDEATATLDPEAVVALRASVAGLADRGCGVLVATQDLRFAEDVCDSIVMLRAGRVIACSSPSDLLRERGVAGLEALLLEALGESSLEEDVRHALAAL